MEIRYYLDPETGLPHIHLSAWLIVAEREGRPLKWLLYERE